MLKTISTKSLAYIMMFTGAFVVSIVINSSIIDATMVILASIFGQSFIQGLMSEISKHYEMDENKS